MSNSTPLSEKAVQQVLARAVELEREHGGALTETQVREIAREASIPTAAIDQALAEYRNNANNSTGITTTPVRRPWRARVWIAVIVVVVLLMLAFAVIPLAIPAPPR